MKLTSSAFDHNQPIPAKYTCDESNINPPLLFEDIPSRTKSLVLIMDDPDAPSGTWVHWVVFNIKPTEKGIGEGLQFSQGADDGMNSWGKPGYGGPCPPSGTHRYIFKLYALDTQLEIHGNPTKEIVEQQMQGHVLEQAELIGLYQRT